MIYESINWPAKFQKLLDELNLQRVEFLYRIPMYRIHFENVCTGRIQPSMDFIEAVCLTYDVNPKWLLGSTALDENAEDHDDEPILLSRRYVRSSEEEILARVRSLMGKQTQSDFAKTTGIGVGALEQFLVGNTRMNFRMARCIALNYHVSMEWLLNGDESSKMYPCDERMIQFVSSHQDLRMMITAAMDISRSGDETVSSVSVGRSGEEAVGSAGDETVEIGTGTDVTDADYLRLLRQRQGLKQKEMGEKLGVTPGMISLIETGRRSLSDELKERINQVFEEGK